MKYKIYPICAQDYFWTFTTMEWATKNIHEGNVFEEAHVAADAYVEQLRRTGVLKWTDGLGPRDMDH